MDDFVIKNKTTTWWWQGKRQLKLFLLNINIFLFIYVYRNHHRSRHHWSWREEKKSRWRRWGKSIKPNRKDTFYGLETAKKNEESEKINNDWLLWGKWRARSLDNMHAEEDMAKVEMIYEMRDRDGDGEFKRREKLNVLIPFKCSRHFFSMLLFFRQISFEDEEVEIANIICYLARPSVTYTKSLSHTHTHKNWIIICYCYWRGSSVSQDGMIKCSFDCTLLEFNLIAQT